MSKIEWTDVTENPIYIRRPDGSNGGHWCRKISEGCANCYAESINNSNYFGFASHLEYSGKPPEGLYFDHAMVEKWRKARSTKKRFICSMTDLFGDWVPVGWQHAIFDAAANSNQIIQLLTKRPDWAASAIDSWLTKTGRSKLPGNIWMGVTVENQLRMNERLELLSVLKSELCEMVWISHEPALSSIDWEEAFEKFKPDWIVCGGESGSNARQCHLDRLRVCVYDCQVADVPVFVKQLGSGFGSKNDRAGGDFSRFPIELQVREFPK